VSGFPGSPKRNARRGSRDPSETQRAAWLRGSKRNWKFLPEKRKAAGNRGFSIM
jgi:hypothetical protein